MKYPTMKPAASHHLTVTGLSGGLNRRDVPSAVGDNQLTELLNLWYRGGRLITRPGLRLADGGRLPLPTGRGGGRQGVRACEITRLSGGCRQRLICRYALGGAAGDSALQFCWIGAGKTDPLPTLTLPGPDPHWFAVQSDRAILVFAAGEGTAPTVRRLDEDGVAWQALSEDDFYAPLILTHCLSEQSLFTTPTDLTALGAAAVEDYNLLGGRYRMIYTSVNRALLNPDSPTGHFMIYTLLHNVRTMTGRRVTARLTRPNGSVYEHSVIIGAPDANNPLKWSVEAQSPGDGLYLGVAGTVLAFFAGPDPSGGFASTTESDFLPDNLEINAPCESDASALFSMTRAVWFAGASTGSESGRRLFLGASTAEDDRDMILWSGLDDPLYFPQNGRARVGDPSGAVTGFGRQADLLIIFKETETYCTRYGSGSFDGLTARFALTQVSTAVGCDLPDTVCLCRNRLVWADSGGTVYTLVGRGQYSERSIFSVSDLVAPLLAKEEMQNAAACEWQGVYLLLCGSRAYVMDYNSYGYQYVSSYSRAEEANRRVPWYVWELPVSGTALPFTAGGAGFLLDLVTADGRPGGNLYLLDPEESSDLLPGVDPATGGDSATERPIDCGFTTRLFDFGRPDRRKVIETLSLNLALMGAGGVTVRFIGDRGSREEELAVTLDGAGEGTGEHLPPDGTALWTLPVGMPGTVRFAAALRRTGGMAVEGFTVNYRI